MNDEVPKKLEVCPTCGTPTGYNPITTNGPFLVDGARGYFAFEDNIVPFTSSELKVLELLVRRPGVVFSKEQILSALDTEAEQKIVDVFICKIRKKLKTQLSSEVSQLLMTHWGRGYSLELPDEPQSVPEGIEKYTQTGRWTPNMKKAIVASITNGELSMEEFMSNTGVSQHEIEGWMRGVVKTTTSTNNDAARASLPDPILDNLPVVDDHDCPGPQAALS